MDKKGRIMEGPKGGQFTAYKSSRPETEGLNCNIDRKPKKRKPIKR